jgi:hypothetical protein
MAVLVNDVALLGKLTLSQSSKLGMILHATEWEKKRHGPFGSVDDDDEETSMENQHRETCKSSVP